MSTERHYERLPKAQLIARYSCFSLFLLAVVELGLQIQEMSMAPLMMRLVIIIGLLMLANEPRLLFLKFSTYLSEEGEPGTRMGRLLSYALVACVIVLLVSSCQPGF